jgi:basic amino acid/polyamine antiporter, APA family
MVIIGTFSSIISFFIFVVVVFIGLSVAGLFVLRRRDSSVPFKTPGYPVTPLIFLFLILLMLFLLAGNNPLQAMLGVLVVLLGLPVYYLFFRHRKS